jgi:cytochrome c-type biogenesis protein CcmH/NrfG
MEAVSELETIKWLLIAILVGMVLVALAAVSVAATIWLGFRMAKENNSGKVFRVVAEEHLARNENDELVEYANERLESHPQDVWAHWYLGQAKFYIGQLPESKRCFERVVELEPSWYGSAESWLERIGEKMEKGPTLVE